MYKQEYKKGHRLIFEHSPDEGGDLHNRQLPIVEGIRERGAEENRRMLEQAGFDFSNNHLLARALTPEKLNNSMYVDNIISLKQNNVALDDDISILEELTLEKGCNKPYVASLRRLQRGGIKIHGDLVKVLSVEKARKPFVEAVIRIYSVLAYRENNTLIMTGTSVENYPGALIIEALSPRAAPRELQFPLPAGIRDAFPEFASLDAYFVEHTLLSPAEPIREMQLPISAADDPKEQLKQSGINVESIDVRFHDGTAESGKSPLTQEKLTNPTYIKNLIKFHQANMSVSDPAFVNALTLEKGTDDEYVDALVRLFHAGFSMLGGHLIKALPLNRVSKSHDAKGEKGDFVTALIKMRAVAELSEQDQVAIVAALGGYSFFTTNS